jgi:hypothetical protein
VQGGFVSNDDVKSDSIRRLRLLAAAMLIPSMGPCEVFEENKEENHGSSRSAFAARRYG